MLRYIIKGFVLIFLFFTHSTLAKNILPRAKNMYIGADIAKLCSRLYQKTGSAWEFDGSISFFPVLIELDYGWALLKRMQRNNLSYTNGRYIKMGLSYNFVTPTAYPNQFAIGVRYARSFFHCQLKSDQLTCHHSADKPCDAQCIVVPSCLKHLKGQGIVHWWELVVSAKVSLKAILSIGSTVRYKFLKTVESPLYVYPFDLPGWGFMDDRCAFGYNLYVCLNIPLQNVNKQKL